VNLAQGDHIRQLRMYICFALKNMSCNNKISDYLGEVPILLCVAQ
jgi:hypothetical protein